MKIFSPLQLWLLILLLTLPMISYPQNVELKEFRHWSFFKEPGVYTSNGYLILQSSDEEGVPLTIFNPQTDKEQKITLKSGEGPGEIAILKGAIIKDNCLLLWDAQLRRLSRYQLPECKFQDSQKFPSMFVFSKLIAFKEDTPVFAVSRSMHDEGKLGMRQQIEGLGPKPFTIMPPTPFSQEMVWTLAVPLLLSAGNETHIALADSTVYRITLQPLDGSAPIIIEQQTDPISWTKTIQTRFDRLDKDQREEMAKFPKPKGVHPLHALSLSTHRLAVCRNECIGDNLAIIDFYTLDGSALGQTPLPAITSQFVVQMPVPFPLGLSLIDDHHLAALHYDDQEEQYFVALYHLPF